MKKWNYKDDEERTRKEREKQRRQQRRNKRGQNPEPEYA
jgi:hypothetical protein